MAATMSRPTLDLPLMKFYCNLVYGGVLLLSFERTITKTCEVIGAMNDFRILNRHYGKNSALAPRRDKA